MYRESIAHRNAIRFRRLYLETISSGEIGNSTAWKLALHVNTALYSSREIVAAMTMMLGVMLFSMPLGSDVLPLQDRLTFFFLATITMFVGHFLILLPLQYLRVRSWIGVSSALIISSLSTILFAAGSFTFYRDALSTGLEFTFLEFALRISPMFLTLFGIAFSLSPYTIVRLTRRTELKGLSNIINARKRGKLYSLSAQDHYVAVTTSAGTDLLRVSLSDAIQMLEPGIGLQIHRSHWVAISAIKTMHEKNRTVELVNGDILPVSAQHSPTLTLELSKRNVLSQQTQLFEREDAKIDTVTKLLGANKDARNKLDKMFLQAFQGKKMTELQQVRIAYQMYRVTMTTSTYTLIQPALFMALAFMGTYGLYTLPWYQPPLFWFFGYLLCALVTIPAQVVAWYLDIKLGSKGWIGILLHMIFEAALATTVLFWFAYFLFGPVTVPYVTFVLSAFMVHLFTTPVQHLFVREHQSYSTWQRALKVPPLVFQLPFEKRGEIVSISADKRLVHVQTTMGTATINTNGFIN